jgi:hypothetical protein
MDMAILPNFCKPSSLLFPQLQPLTFHPHSTPDHYFTQDVDIAAQATNKPNTMIAETGWPTASMDAASGNDGAPSPGGDASVANLQTFLDTFVCAANTVSCVGAAGKEKGGEKAPLVFFF